MSHHLNKLLPCCIAISAFPACTVEADRETEPHQSVSNGADVEAAPLHGAAAHQNFTPDGETGGPQVANSAILATSVTACFQLNNGSSTFFINATLNVNAYPYTIIGGSISGTICDSPNWTLTGGTVGSDITINGSHVGTATCASTVAIVAPFGPPAGYAGTYGFNGANNSFSHRTLFLGFNRFCP